MAFDYPFDPTGLDVGNKITGENHIISPPGWLDFYFIVPRYAPFFRDGVTVKHYPSNQVLHEGVDFVFSHRFHDASLATGKMVYGSITILDKTLTGVLEIGYQTIGGAWTISEAEILTILANATQNPRITTWEQVVNLPSTFPVIDHQWHLDDMVGMSEIEAALYAIEQAILANSGNALQDHIDDKNNPHEVTAAQVGLGDVQNYGMASLLDMETGTVNNKLTTPLRVKQAIDYHVLNAFNNHLNDFTNPHNVVKSQVGLGNVQNYGIATLPDALAGTHHTSYMTPLRVRQVVDAVAINALNTHIGDFNNPHQVTKIQVGLGNVENYPIATITQAQAGLDNSSYMTPLRVRQAIDSTSSADLTAHLNDYNNPHQVNKLQVGLGLVQNYPIATMNEAILGTDNDKYMTPLRVKEVIQATAQTDLLNHINNTNNPHLTTKAHVGLGDVDNYPTATIAQTVAGLSESLFVTPAGVKAAVETIDTTTFYNHINNINNPHNVTKDQVGLGQVENYGIATKNAAEAGVDNNAYMTPLRVKEAIMAMGGNAITTHLTDYNNPHQVTKAQVGLGSVENYGIALQLQAEGGILNDRYMTPLRTKNAIDAQIRPDLNAHVTDFNNPHQVTKAQVGLGNVQNFPIASLADAHAGVASDLYMTPALVAAAIANSSGASITAHLTDFNNPHQVNKTQVGLGNVENYGIATKAEAEAGIVNVKYMTPLRVKEAFTQFSSDSGFTNHLTDYNNPHQVTAAQVNAYDKTEIDGMFSNSENEALHNSETAVQSAALKIDFANVVDDTAIALADYQDSRIFGEMMSRHTTHVVTSSGRLTHPNGRKGIEGMVDATGAFTSSARILSTPSLDPFDNTLYLATAGVSIINKTVQFDFSNNIVNGLSGNEKGMAVGICIAHRTIAGYSHGLYLMRTDGGFDGKGLLCLVYNPFQTNEQILVNTYDTFSWGDGVINGARLHSDYAGATNGTNHIGNSTQSSSFRIHFTKNGSSLVYKMSEFGSPSTWAVDDTFDLTFYPEIKTIFDEPSDWGVCTVGFSESVFTRQESPNPYYPYYAASGIVNTDPLTHIDHRDIPYIRRYEYSGIAADPSVTHSAGAMEPFASNNSHREDWSNRLIYSPKTGKLYLGRPDGGLTHLLIDADSVNGETVITP